MFTAYSTYDSGRAKKQDFKIQWPHTPQRTGSQVCPFLSYPEDTKSRTNPIKRLPIVSSSGDLEWLVSVSYPGSRV